MCLNRPYNVLICTGFRERSGDDLTTIECPSADAASTTATAECAVEEEAEGGGGVVGRV